MCLLRLLFWTHFKLQVNNLISSLGVSNQQEQYCPDLLISYLTFSLGRSASGWLDKVCSLLHVLLILLPYSTSSFPAELSASLVLSLQTAVHLRNVTDTSTLHGLKPLWLSIVYQMAGTKSAPLILVAGLWVHEVPGNADPYGSGMAHLYLLLASLARELCFCLSL